jgi:small subunit ribosomal protein S1
LTAEEPGPAQAGGTNEREDAATTTAIDSDSAMSARSEDDALPAQPAPETNSRQSDDGVRSSTDDGVMSSADDGVTSSADDGVMSSRSDGGAIGSSGAALGDAASVADRVGQAVGTATAERTTTPEPTPGTERDDRAFEDAPPAAPTENGSGPQDLGPEPTTMEELLGEQTEQIKSFKHGDVVEGTVVRIDKDEILVDIGAKSEGVVSNRELYGRHQEGQTQLKIGDVVLVYVLQPESNEGHVVLSLRRAGLERKWRSMQEQFESGVIIEAPVIDHNKGGLIVDCGIRGFVPISQIVDFPRRPQNDQPRDAAQEIAEKLQPFVGRKLRLKILEVNRKANRLILSEKVALYEERREKRDELFSSLKVGQRVKGTVRSIAPFGVFVDLGGIDGLVHKSELSWNKVNNPEAGYRMGEEVEAEVIDINHERGRISLSIRRLQPDPWHSTVADFRVGDVIDGTVTKIVNFGAFVRVREGLEGLIHISELSHQRVAHPADVVHEGQRLKLKIISLDQERHRLGLSLKQAEEPPARPAEQAAAAPARERRGRQERYDASQAVQEPEGGIDNTLAAAFAQVRQQVEESEARTDGSAQPPEATARAGELATGETLNEATAEPSSEGTAPSPTAEMQSQATSVDGEVDEKANAPAPASVTAAPTEDRGNDAATAEIPAPPVAEAETDGAPGARKGSRSSKAKAGSRSVKSEREGEAAPAGAQGPTDEVAAAEASGDRPAEGTGGGQDGRAAFDTTAEGTGETAGASDESTTASRAERSSPDA